MLDEAVEEKAGGEKVRIGMVVSPPKFISSRQIIASWRLKFVDEINLLISAAVLLIGHQREFCSDA